MKITNILQDGNIFSAAVLDLSIDVILAKFKNAIANQAKVSLAIGVPSAASAPHSLLNGFKNLVAVAAECGWEFDQAKPVLAAARSSTGGGAGPAAAAAAPKEEVKDEEEPVDMGDLFGGDDEY